MFGLKAWRKRAGLQQKELAVRLSVTPAAVNLWESGKRDIPNAKLREVFQMGASVEELFGVEYNRIHGLVKASDVPETPAQAPDLQAILQRLDSLEQAQRRLDQPSKAG